MRELVRLVCWALYSDQFPIVSLVPKVYVVGYTCRLRICKLWIGDCIRGLQAGLSTMKAFGNILPINSLTHPGRRNFDALGNRARKHGLHIDHHLHRLRDQFLILGLTQLV